MLPRHTNIIKSVSESEVPFFLFLQYSKIHTDSITKIAKKFDDLDESFFTEEQRKINEVNFTKSMQDAGKYSINIMDNIKKLGLLDNTIVVFFSDHGTSLGEKYGEKMYGSFTYDYTIKTFALFINKICPSKKISTQVRSIDIAPTLLEMLDIEAVKGVNSMDGQSLMPLMAETERKSMFDFFKRKDKNRIAYVETGGLGGPWPSPNAPNVKCIRTPDSKIIYNLTPDTWEFYDLKNDPHENNNLIDKDTKEIRQMVKLLRERL